MKIKLLRKFWHLLPNCYSYVWVVTEAGPFLLGFYVLYKGNKVDLFYLPYNY